MDSARSWLVAASCCWMSSFGFVMIRSSGIIYVSIIEQFQVTREEASWPVTLPTNTYMLSGLLASIVARYTDTWKITLAGCVLGCLAVCACFFASETLHLTLLLGVVYGAGISVLRLNTMVVNQHFVRYRAAASGINMAGNSISGFVFPPLVQYFSTYGLRGTFLLSGALMLNSIAGPIFQRASPAPQQHRATKPTQRSTRKLNSETYSSLQTEVVVSDDEKRSHQKRIYYDEATSQYEHQNGDRVSRSLVTATDLCNNQVECEAPTKSISDVALSSTNDNGGLCGSKRNRTNSTNSLMTPKGETLHSTHTDKNVASNSKEVKRKRCLSFLKSPMFYLVMSTQAVISFNMTSYLTVIVDFAVDRGISKWNSVFLLSSYTVTDLAARLGSGWITDRHVFTRSTWTAVNFLLWAVSLFVIPVCNDYYYQVSMSVVAGWCNGSTLTLIPVLLMDIVELSEYGVCYGVSSFAVGVLGFLRPSMIGHYRDKLGDYEGLFFLLGQCTLVLAFFWMCASAYDRCLANRHKKALRPTQGYFWRLGKLESMGNKDINSS
ncbi:unnamed protein product [Ixodes persulcatus]